MADAKASGRWPARGDTDDRVHVVDATEDILLDPSPYRSRCGQQVMEAYNDRREPTCPDCLKGEAR